MDGDLPVCDNWAGIQWSGAETMDSQRDPYNLSRQSKHCDETDPANREKQRSPTVNGKASLSFSEKGLKSNQNELKV